MAARGGGEAPASEGAVPRITSAKSPLQVLACNLDTSREPALDGLIEVRGAAMPGVACGLWGGAGRGGCIRRTSAAEEALSFCDCHSDVCQPRPATCCRTLP